MKDVLLYGPSIPHQSLKGLGDDIDAQIAMQEQAIKALQSTIKMYSNDINIMKPMLADYQNTLDAATNEARLLENMLQSAYSEQIYIKYKALINGTLPEARRLVQSKQQKIDEDTKKIKEAETKLAEHQRILNDLIIIRDGKDMFSTSPTVTVTVQPTTPKTIILPTPEPTPTQTTPEPEPGPETEPVQTPIFKLPSFEDEGDGASEPEEASDAEIYDIVDEAPDTETETTDIKIPWYVYALGAGALLLGGVLLFGKKKKKNN